MQETPETHERGQREGGGIHVYMGKEYILRRMQTLYAHLTTNLKDENP